MNPARWAASWTETHSTTTNSIGVVSVTLGSVTPISLGDFPGPLWLEIDVNGETMSPRRRLTAAPYAFAAFGSSRLGGLASSEYATDAELSSPGSINDPGNPVDWTNLKGVPSGFADGTDDVGGAGDGHSLDAWDGDPVDAVWVAGQGRVGIGTTQPMATVHAHVDTEYYCSLRLTNQMTGATSGDGLYLSMSPWNEACLTNNEDGPLYLSAGDGHPTAIRPDGSVWIARGASTSVEFHVYGQPGGLNPLHRSFGDEYGGQFELQDDAGNVAVTYGADDSGTGGRLQVSKDASYDVDKGIDLNGNWGGTEEPALRVLGSSRSATFFMNQSGDSSVFLPLDAIGDYEIVDEPGAAAVASNTSVALTSTTAAVTSASITTPQPGYVLVIATCQVSITHTNGTGTDVDLGVSDSASTYPPNQDVNLYLSSAAPSGSYAWPVSVTGLFEADSAGTYTYYLLATEYSGAATVYDMQLSLVYMPTAYGAVTPTRASDADEGRDELAVARGPVTGAEVAAQRAGAKAFDLARIERELAEIQAQVEAMKEEP